MKQTTRNSKLRSNLRGWELMLLAVGCFAPSKAFLNYLLAHIQTNSSSSVGDIGMIAVSAHGRLMTTLEKGERLAAPSYYEMQCSLTFSTIQCTIELPYYSTLAYSIAPHTRAKDLISLIADSLWVSIEDLQGYALYVELPERDNSSAVGAMLSEFFSGVKILTDNSKTPSSWRSIQPNNVIVDIWRFVEEYCGANKSYVTSHYRMKLMRKIVIGKWPPMPKPNSAIFEKLEVSQAYQDIIASKYPTSTADATRLAALYLQLNFGDIDHPGNREKVTERELNKYVSKEHLANPEVSPAQLIQIINIAYENLRGIDKSDAQNELLSTLRRKWSLYGSSLFFVKQHKAPNVGWLAISQKGIDLLSYPSLNPVKSWPITTISSWNSEASSFHFSSGSLFSPAKEHFTTHEALEIASVLKDYITYLTSLTDPPPPSPVPPPVAKQAPSSAQKRASIAIPGVVKKTLARATSSIQIGRVSRASAVIQK